MTTEIPALKLNDQRMQSAIDGAATLYEKIDAAAGTLWEVDAKMHESTGALESALSEDFASLEIYLVELESLQEPRFRDAVIEAAIENYGEYVTSDMMEKLEKFISEVAAHEL